jgi:hypothetical protein
VIDVLEAAEGAPITVRVRAPRARAVLPWLVPAAGLLVALHVSDTPDRYIALYTVYYTMAVVVPGTLTFRALRGSRGNLPEDLGLGTATGLLLLLIGWALCAATRLQMLLPGWPLLIIAVFLAVPRLRRCWRIPAAEREPLPLAWSWIIAGALCLIVADNYRWWASTPLPPATTAYFQDFMYHLALVHEMTRSIPFQVPQLAGNTLRYHYLSDADMAAASMITRIPPAVVLLRLWIVPISGLVAFVSAALGRQITGKWWGGALAGAASVVALPLALGEPVGAFGQTPMSAESPSEVFSIPLLGLLVVVAIDVLAGRRLGWAWAMVFPLALSCAGAKSSALPPFVAGLVLAGLVVAWHYRGRLRATALFLGVTLVAMLAGAKIFAGGGAGTLTVQPFAILDWVTPYHSTIGSQDTIDGSRLLPLGVEHAGLRGGLFIAGLVCWWLALQSPRILGLLTLVRRRAPADPTAWLLAGMTTAGAAGSWLLWHPSASQVYFFLGVAPFGAVLTVSLLTGRALSWRPVVAGLGAGAVWALLAPSVARPRHNTMAAWIWALAEPLLWSAAAALVVAAAALLLWRRFTGRYAWQALPSGAIAAILGAALAIGVQGTAEMAVKHLTPHHHPAAVAAPSPPANTPAKQAIPASVSRVVTADEMRAALWLDGHANRDDLIATNVHCRLITAGGACDARAFWVSALTGRRALVESWGYTDQAVSADGANGLRYYLQPAPDQQVYALNQRVFTQPTAADLSTLRDVYHVKWLLADKRAPGGVPAALDRMARMRYTSGPVTIYQL